MRLETNWARLKAHRGRLNNQDVQGLSAILFRDCENWLEEKLDRREDAALVIEVLGFLAQCGSTEATAILLRQLESGEEALQAAAAEALKLCPPILAKEALAEVMLRQSRSAVKAGEVLLSYGADGADELWRLWFADNSRTSLKAQVLQLLAETLDSRTEQLAYLGFLSGEDELKRAALKSADKLETGHLWGNVALCLSHPDWRIRAGAVRLLRKWGEAKAKPYLVMMGADPDPWVEDERLKAIAEMERVV